MKKLLSLFILIFLTVVQAFAEDNSKTYKLSAETVVGVELKDPKLIHITETDAIDQKLYATKLTNDEKQYSVYKKQTDNDYYKLYRIVEKLVRANNLYYQNWRLMIKADAEDVNASAGSANLIIVHSSLYDSLYDNEDALAFVLSHELGHFVLDHHQTSLENSYKIMELEAELKKAHYEMRNQNSLARINNIYGNGYGALGNQLSSTAYMVAVVSINKTINKIYEQERMFEYDADSEAVTIMARAGYDVKNSQDALEFLAKLPSIYTSRSSHPQTADRIKNINEVIELSDIAELKKEGEKNIYNSKVLPIKKSSDKKTIVMSNYTGNGKVSYSQKTKTDKMLEKAYIAYLNRDMKTAETYFLKAFEKTPSEYTAPLYLSYIYEYKFLTDNDKKNLRTAAHWSKIANKINPTDKNVTQQKADIIADFKKLKTGKKTEQLQAQ